MKNKLVFRIIGALGSALIIASIFIPYVSVEGYSVSVWGSNEQSLYLPIMILVFGAISALVFALNKKTEFAYMSTGAITFFLVMQTIDIINQNAFKTMSVGYYGLCIGTLLMGIMAFLTNLKGKKIEVKEEVELKEQETSVLEKIDNLYSEQTIQQPVVTPIEPIEPVQSIQPIEPVVIPVEPVMQNQEVIQQPIESQVQPQPVVQPQLTEPVMEQPIEEKPVEIQPTVNPVVQEFSQQIVQPQPTEPVIEQPIEEKPVEIQPTVNPVVQEFSQQIVQPQPVVQPQPTEPVIEQPIEEKPIENNPVVQEFLNPQNSTSQVNPSADKGLDIFNQPLR